MRDRFFRHKFENHETQDDSFPARSRLVGRGAAKSRFDVDDCRVYQNPTHAESESGELSCFLETSLQPWRVIDWRTRVGKPS